MCPVLKKLLLLTIYWTSSFSLNFSTLRDLHKGNRTWAGEAKSQSMCYFCFEWIWLRIHQFTYCQSSLFICDICWLSVVQRWCPTKPDHCPALPPRSWGSDASTERGAHPWTVSMDRNFIFAKGKIKKKSHSKMIILVFSSSVHSMVNLDETSLYAGMEYGAFNSCI